MMTTDVIQVRRAVREDGSYIDHLQRKYPHELGMLPWMALDAYISSKRVEIGLLNDEPASYILGTDANTRNPTTAKIVQACVQYDARHRTLGERLVNKFCDSLARTTQDLVLYCASDLEANLFWEHCGFTPKAWRWGSTKKGRVHILWHRQIRSVPGAMAFQVPTMSMPGSFREKREVFPLTEDASWTDVNTIARLKRPGQMFVPFSQKRPLVLFDGKPPSDALPMRNVNSVPRLVKRAVRSLNRRSVARNLTPGENARGVLKSGCVCSGFILKG